MIPREYIPAMVGKTMQVMITIPHNYQRSNNIDETEDVTDIYVEQSAVGGRDCEIKIVQGCLSFGLTFLDEKQLDRLSIFFATAAQQLRYCTKECK